MTRRAAVVNENRDKPKTSFFRKLALKRSEDAENNTPPVELAPAMPELGTAPCPVCGHKVAVFVTRTKRPFINCGFCSARIFYNGSRSMQLLHKELKGYPATIVQPKGVLQTEQSENPIARALPFTGRGRRSR
jgi:DNA-directed RNA polymerase subunit RPC12/RpoP